MSSNKTDTTSITIAIYGDCALDLDVRRDNFRPVQEDPTIRVLPAPDPDSHHGAPGGAANLALNLAALGCKVVLYAPWAPDRAGVRLAELLASGNVQVRPWGFCDKTTLKTRYYASDRLCGRVDSDGTVTLYRAPPEETFDAVVLTDYGKGAFPHAHSAQEWAKLSRFAFADPYPGRANLWKHVPLDTITLNWNEAETLLSARGDPASDLDASAFVEAATMSLPCAGRVIVKRGRYGSAAAYRLAATDRAHVDLVPPYHPLAICDAQGAGDTYLAGYVAARSRGTIPLDAYHYASAAASIAVAKPGTAIATSDEVKAVCRERATCDVLAHSVTSLETVARSVRRAQTFGFRLGYTNGVFDLRPTAGHRHVLAEAAKNCDILFVGVDSDHRVRRLKGDDRPIVTETERAAAVAAMSGVHAAFVFDCSPAEVLKALNPDVLFKGGYAREQMHEIDQSGWKGEFVDVGIVEGESTTKLIERISAPIVAYRS